jgi:Cytochrome P460
MEALKSGRSEPRMLMRSDTFTSVACSHRTLALLVLALVGCPGSSTTTRSRAADPESEFAPLEVGALYLTYPKLTDKPFLSLDHGNRWVEVYVNDIGVAAYDSAGPIPVGTIIVKASWLDDGGKPGARGPLYIMQKRAAGYDPEHRDWWYAMHWETPSSGPPRYWRGRSPRIAFCAGCHDSYDRSLGGLIPSSVLKR